MYWNDVKEPRFYGLIEQIEFYVWKVYDGAKLSKAQIKHVKELKQQICVFGERAQKYEELCNEILAN